MKARLEEASVQYRGVVLVSETDEEKKMLWDIWENRGRPVTVGRLDDGSVELVVAPTPEVISDKQRD